MSVLVWRVGFFGSRIDSGSLVAALRRDPIDDKQFWGDDADSALAGSLALVLLSRFGLVLAYPNCVSHGQNFKHLPQAAFADDRSFRPHAYRASMLHL